MLPVADYTGATLSVLLVTGELSFLLSWWVVSLCAHGSVEEPGVRGGSVWKRKPHRYCREFSSNGIFFSLKEVYCSEFLVKGKNNIKKRSV